MARNIPGHILTILVTGILTLFIAYPIAAVLAESFVVSGPLSPKQLKVITVEALDALPPAERDDTIRRWTGTVTDKERIEATAAAFALADVPVSWDRQAAYSDQAKAMEAAIAGLPADQRIAVEENAGIAHVMLHKRIALAFKVKDLVSQDKYDALRSGVAKGRGLDHYLKLFEDSYLRTAALNSLMLATLSVVFTVTLAFALAYGVNSGAVPWHGATRAIILLPLVAPPVLIATATVMLFGRRGLVTHTILDQGLGLIDSDETNLYGFFGVVLAQTLACVPAAFIVMDNILRRKSGRIDEAAASLGANYTRIFGQVGLPLAWPAIKRAIVLVFIMSLTDFGTPLILGRDTPVLAGIIYDEITAYRNTPLAAALCVWLLVPSLILYLAMEMLGRRKGYSTGEFVTRSELPVPPLWTFTFRTVVGIVIALVIVIYGTMALGSVTRVWGVDWTLTLGYFTSEGVNVGLAHTGYGSSERGLGLVLDSITIAGIAGPIGGLLAIAVAYTVERIRPPGRNLIAFMALIPAILPGIIFGIGYIVAFNVPFGVKELSLTGTSAILVLNILFSNLFVGVLAARAVLQRLDQSIDEAAESLGAGLTRRFTQVILPMLRPAMLLGTLYVFVDGLTTLSSVIFLVSGNHKLASVAIFNHANSGEYGYAAAKSLAILVVALMAMALIRIAERRETRATKRSRTAPVENVLNEAAMAGDMR